MFSPSSPSIDAWRDQLTRQFAQRLSLHKTTAARRMSVQKGSSSSSSSKQQPKKENVTHQTILSQVPTSSALKPTVHDLTVAARRAGAEAAAKRRRRTDFLAAKLGGPLVRQALFEWRDSIEVEYCALVHRREVASFAAIGKWLDACTAARRQAKWRLLRRWRVALRVANARFDREDFLAAQTRKKSLWKAMRKLASRVATRKLSLAAAEEGRVRAIWQRVCVWQRVAAARAFAFRSVRLRSTLRKLERHARLSRLPHNYYRIGRLCVALERWREEMGQRQDERRLRCAFAYLKARHRVRAEEVATRRTMAYAAIWHAQRAAEQHTLARLLLCGWRYKKRDERMADATIIGDTASLTRAITQWRSDAIVAAARRATRRALKGGFGGSGSAAAASAAPAAPAAPAAAVPSSMPPLPFAPLAPLQQQHTAAASARLGGRRSSSIPGESGGDSSGDSMASYLLHAAELALTSPSCPPPKSRFRADYTRKAAVASTRQQQQPAPLVVVPRPAPDATSEALLDALVKNRTGHELRPPNRQMAPAADSEPAPGAAVAAAAAQHETTTSPTQPPPAALASAPPSISLKLMVSARQQQQQQQQQQVAEDVAVRVTHGGAPRFEAERFAGAMAGLRQKLALEVPQPSYLALPPAQRGGAGAGGFTASVRLREGEEEEEDGSVFHV